MVRVRPLWHVVYRPAGHVTGTLTGPAGGVRTIGHSNEAFPAPTVVPEPREPGAAQPARRDHRIGGGAVSGRQDRWQMLVLAGCNAVPRLNGSPYADIPAHRGTRSTSGGACEPLRGRGALSDIGVGVPGGAAGWLNAWSGANICRAAPSLWLRAVCQSRSPAAAEAAGRDCLRCAGSPDAGRLSCRGWRARVPSLRHARQRHRQRIRRPCR